MRLRDVDSSGSAMTMSLTTFRWISHPFLQCCVPGRSCADRLQSGGSVSFFSAVRHIFHKVLASRIFWSGLLR